MSESKRRAPIGLAVLTMLVQVSCTSDEKAAVVPTAPAVVVDSGLVALSLQSFSDSTSAVLLRVGGALVKSVTSTSTRVFVSALGENEWSVLVLAPFELGSSFVTLAHRDRKRLSETGVKVVEVLGSKETGYANKDLISTRVELTRQ